MEENSGVINFSYYTFPVIVDWNEDGLMDLLMHGRHNWDNATNLVLYINEGTAQQYKFSRGLQSEAEGGTGLPYIEPRVSPEVIDLDKDGKKDVLLGMPGGTIRFYKNIGTNSAPKLDDPVNLNHEGGSTWDRRALEVKLCVDDLNNDGAWDIVFGGELAELYLYVAWGIPDNTNNNEIQNHNTIFEQQLTKNNMITVTSKGIHINNQCDEPISIRFWNSRGQQLIKTSVRAQKKIMLRKKGLNITNNVVFMQVSSKKGHYFRKITLTSN